MILCNLCAKHQATIYFKGIVNDQTIKLHLCDSCAKKKGMTYPFAAATFSLGDMLATLASASGAIGSPLSARCETCHLTYAELKETSQLGCSGCYKTFAPILGPLLQRIHGSTQHVGKVLERTVRPETLMQDLARLKVELSDAVKNEDYEKAARLRDEIKTVETRLMEVARSQKRPS